MFYQNFLALCAQRGVSPNEAAKACGVKSSGTVTGWKNGSAPRQAVLQRLSDYFGVPVSELLADKKIPAAGSDGLDVDPNVSPSLSEKRREASRLLEHLDERELSLLLLQLRGIVLGR